MVTFALILLWRDPFVFWNDDYQISILPVFEDIARSWNEGQFPLLSPYSWVCGNLAGEFQYGTFSVFVNAAVIVVWRIFSGFAHQASALSFVHLVVLATGGFALARGRHLSVPLAMMVALIAALNGWIICWGASDWFGALGAFAWIPWTWWACERALKAPNRTTFLWPAPFAYLVVTGGFPYTIVMLAVIVGWLTLRTLVERKSISAVLPMLFGVALGFGLGAPAILALLSYVHGSAREGQPAAAHWQWIVPPTALPGVILPAWTVKWADFSTRYMSHAGTELACGLVAPSALLAGLIFHTRKVVRKLNWELLLLAVALILAMLPTAGLFRWSFRWLPLLHLVLALCAAECLQLLGNATGLGRRKLTIKLPSVLALTLLAGVAATMSALDTSGTYAWPLTALLLILAALWAGSEVLPMEGRAPASLAPENLPASQELRPPSARFGALIAAMKHWAPLLITFASLLATYLCIPPNCGVPRYNFTESLIDPAPLDPNRLYLSVYPSAESTYRMEERPQPVGQIVRPGSASMWGRLRFINGYSPIRPSGVARNFFFSIHGEIDSGTAFWLLYGEAGADGLLAQLGIDGLTIAKEIWMDPEPKSEWELITSTDEGRVFHRRGGALPRIRSVASLPSRRDSEYTRATITGISESRTSASADVQVPAGEAPALITFSRPYFDGYTATLNGKDVPVTSERRLFPVIELAAGSRGHLVLRYRPNWLIWGASVAIGCAALVVAAVFAALFTRRVANDE